MLFLRIRGDTIKYASSLKKNNKTKEDQLLKDIAYLESQLDNNYQLLMDKQLELENLRKIEVDGEQIRSRHQWLKEGEKPSKFFCNLENKNFIEKTIKSVQLQDGSFVTEQNQVLSHIRNFYVHLFANKDDTLDFNNIHKVLENLPTNTVRDNNLGDPITTIELASVLKKTE